MSDNQQPQEQITKEAKPQYAERHHNEVVEPLRGSDSEEFSRKPSKISEYFGRKASDSKATQQDASQPVFAVAQASDRFQATGNFPGSELIYLDDVGQDGCLRRTYYKSIDQMSEVNKTKPSTSRPNMQYSSQFGQTSQEKKKSIGSHGPHPSGKSSRYDGLISAHDPRIETALLDETSILSNLEIVKQRSIEERSAGAADPRSRSKSANRLSAMKENSYPSPHVAQQLDFGRTAGSTSQSKRKVISRESGEMPEYLSADSREIREALRMQARETPEALDESSEGRTVHGYTEIKHRMMNEFGEELVLDSSTSNQKQRKLLIPSHSSKNLHRTSLKSDLQARSQPAVTAIELRNANLMCSRSTQTDTSSGNGPLFSSSLCMGCLNATNLQPLQLSFGTNGNLDNTNSKDSTRQERLKFEYDKLSYQPSRKMIEELRQIHKESDLRNKLSSQKMAGKLNAQSEFHAEMSSDSKGGIRIYDPFVQKRNLIRQKATESGTGKKSSTQSNVKGENRTSRALVSASIKPDLVQVDNKPIKQSPLKINQKSYLSNFESKLSFYENSDIKYFSLERRRSRERMGEETTDRQRPTTHNTGRSYMSGSKSTGQLQQVGTYVHGHDSKEPVQEMDREKIKRIFEVDSRMHGKETTSNPDQALGNPHYYVTKGLGGVSRKLASEFTRDQQQNRPSNEIADANRYQRRKSSVSGLSNSQSRIKIKQDKQRLMHPTRAELASRSQKLQDGPNKKASMLSSSHLEANQSQLNHSKASYTKSKGTEVSHSATGDKPNTHGATKSTAMTSKLKELSSMARQPEQGSQQVSISPFDPVASSTRVVGPPSKKAFQGASQNIQIPISLNINLTSSGGAHLSDGKGFSTAGCKDPQATFATNTYRQAHRPDHTEHQGHRQNTTQQGKHQPQVHEHADADDSLALFEQELSLTLRQAEDSRLLPLDAQARVAARKQLFDCVCSCVLHTLRCTPPVCPSPCAHLLFVCLCVCASFRVCGAFVCLCTHIVCSTVWMTPNKAKRVTFHLVIWL